VLVSRVKMRWGPDQSRYAASAITTNRAPRLPAQVGLVCQQRLMIYQLVESQVHRQRFHACGATRLKGVVELVDTEFNARL
jgi:hypothetical protein